MSYELIISEKPQAAEKIAFALADTKPVKTRDSDVNYFTLTHNGKPIRVASAVGHLYILGETGGESWKYPVFDTEWKPIYKVNKKAGYTKDYITLLSKLGKDADEITIASDFDIEGEVIGLNIIRFACGRKDANRMKFSTLTKQELVKSYENKQKHLEWGQARAGETRHTLDWYYGINLSRALTSAIKKGLGHFKVLSAGRVQAPFLHFLADRERKIGAFKSQVFWEIYLHGISNKVKVSAQYELPAEKMKELAEEDEEGEEKKVADKFKIFDENWKTTVVSQTEGKNGTITKVEAKQYKQQPPIPFDLTSLQMEASTMLGLTPKKTLELAQQLYVNGYTSYPRTSSQKLPAELNLKEVLTNLKKQPMYKDKVEIVLSINPGIKPNEGQKTDPAHPAIYPTGQQPEKLDSYEAKLYDLVVKRFLAVFGNAATRETNSVAIDVNGHIFSLKGTRTIDPQWHLLYEPYLKFEEVELPRLEKVAKVENEEIEELKKDTAPPKRYTQASIIKELEKRNLGTKATRASILDNLYERGYVVDKSIKVTELGMKMDEFLASEMPMIVDEQLTRFFEDEMEKIREEKSEPSKVLDSAKEKLMVVLTDVSKREKEIGLKLAGASKDADFAQAKIAKCPKCADGTLMLKFSYKTKRKFVACNKYPACTAIYNLPFAKIIKGLDEDGVSEDGKIYVLAGNTDGNLRKICINDETPAQEEKELGHKKYEQEGMECPNCHKGQMVLRKSFYGEFLGCNQYPACKTMMKIIKGEVNTTPIVPQPKKEAPKKTKESKKTTDEPTEEKPKKTKTSAKKKSSTQ